jgi:NTP pyrophosphatase (non-canonical NTP hydrolase)
MLILKIININIKIILIKVLQMVKKRQKLIKELYHSKDAQRGPLKTFACLIEEIGELSRALLGNSEENLKEEAADVMAWLMSLANVSGFDLADAFDKKYPGKCIKCGCFPCICPIRKTGGTTQAAPLAGHLDPPLKRNLNNDIGK